MESAVVAVSFMFGLAVVIGVHGIRTLVAELRTLRKE